MTLRVMLIPGIRGQVPQSVRNYERALARFLQSETRAKVVVGSFCPELAWLPRDRRLRANYLDAAKLLLLPAQLKRLKADVFHLLDHSHGAWVRALEPGKTVVTCHDLIPFARPEMWRTRWGRLVGRRLFALNVRRMTEARAIIAPSQATRSDLRRFLGVPDSAVTVIPMGVDTETYHPVPARERLAARERLGLPGEARVVLHVGTCDHYKNVNGILSVFERVRGEVAEALLVKVGEPFRAECANWIEARELGPAIHGLGRLGGPALVDAYHAADVLLFPSLYEGFGLPVLEAMACGTPVVASLGGALPEVAGDAALLCHPGDHEGLAGAVIRLLRDEEERRCHSESGLRRASEFGWDRTVRRTWECYDSVKQGERYPYVAAGSDRP